MALCSDLWIDRRNVSAHRLHINVYDTVLRGDRGLTEVTSDDILKALVHVQATKQLLLGMLENYRGIYISLSASYICYKKNYIYSIDNFQSYNV